MGKQINFYIDSETEKKLVDLIFSKGYIFLEESREINNITYIYNASEFYNRKFNRQLFIYKAELGELVIRESSYGIKTIDRDVSYVIEFDRNSINYDKRVVHRGRLWYQTSYWSGNSQLIKKSENISKAYNQLARWVAKNAPKGKYKAKGAFTEGMLEEYITPAM